MHEWANYAISKPGSSNAGFAVREFGAVRHIARPKQSRRILEDGYLRAGLVNDGGPLEVSRTCVNFLSPNTWTGGSIYGNVEWTYDLGLLAAAKNLYWVNAKTRYNHPICPPPRKVGLSPSACIRRVQILEEQKAIRGYTAIVAVTWERERHMEIVRIRVCARPTTCLTASRRRSCAITRSANATS